MTTTLRAVASYSCLPCRGQGVVWAADRTIPANWCPLCHGAGKGEAPLDGDGTMTLQEAEDTIRAAGLHPEWIGQDVLNCGDGTRIETWRIYGGRLWAAEATLAEAVTAVLAQRDALAEGAQP